MEVFAQQMTVAEEELERLKREMAATALLTCMGAALNAHDPSSATLGLGLCSLPLAQRDPAQICMQDL